jgi:hypothetical protein
MPPRLVPVRPQSLPRRFYAKPNGSLNTPQPSPPLRKRSSAPPSSSPNPAGTYFESRKRLSWWKRQDFDDKMTYVVCTPTTARGVDVVGDGDVYDGVLLGLVDNGYCEVEGYTVTGRDSLPRMDGLIVGSV